MMLDSLFDLSAFSKRWLGREPYKLLAEMIRDAQRLASLHSDLSMSIELLDVLEAQLALPHLDEKARTIISFALLNNSLILYARATDGNSKGRPSFDLQPKFDEGQKAVHAELMALRNQVIAHFDTCGSFNGRWFKERFILQGSSRDPKPQAVNLRLTFDLELLSRARKQIVLAHGFLKEIAMHKIEEVADKLRTLDHELFEVEMRQHQVSSEELQGLEIAAGKIRSDLNSRNYASVFMGSLG